MTTAAWSRPASGGSSTSASAPLGCSVGHQLVPGDRDRTEAWAGRTVEALLDLDLGFDENMPGFQCEGLNPRNQPRRCRSRTTT